MAGKRLQVAGGGRWPVSEEDAGALRHETADSDAREEKASHDDEAEGGQHLRRIPPPREPRHPAFPLGERRFCKTCGSALWVWDPRWPELVHPFASAIDTDLPVPPERVHLMLAYAPDWVQPDIGDKDQQFDEYPLESIAGWHDKRGLVSKD